LQESEPGFRDVLRNGQVNVSRLATGTYVLQVQSGGRLIAQRFTKG